LEDDVEIVGLATQGIWLDDNVAIGRGTLIKPTSYYGRNLGEGLRIGARSSIGPLGYVGCSGFISIGKNVLIGPRVSMHAENHRFLDADIPIKEQGVVLEPIVIEDDCWIGSDVILLGGVTIGHGAVVAAGSVVTKSIAPREVVAGVPARVIGGRRD
jgi:acetyltransferase-like isoleucine patch superfamily enzyme